MCSTLICLLFVGCDEHRTIVSDLVTVIDGDTIEFESVRYRLTGFDTPETYNAKCDIEYDRGKQAEDKLRQLIESVGRVQLNIQPSTDKYGRGLAKLFVSGEDVGSILIRAGLARTYRSGSRSTWC